MKSGNLKQVIELVGISALLFSVVFLGYELKRSNDIAEAEASMVMYGEANRFIETLLSDRELLNIWLTGIAEFDSLSQDDIAIFWT